MKKLIYSLISLSLLTLTACSIESNTDGATESSSLYSGEYCAHWLEGQESQMILDSSTMTITILGQEFGVAENPTIADDVLTASIPFVDEANEMDITLDFTLNFNPENRDEFSGTYSMEFMDIVSTGTISGVKGACTNPTYDLDNQYPPQMASAHYIDLNDIDEISLFRSNQGHSYVDYYEQCRSMKHYFVPDANLDWSTLEIDSPIDGTVYSMFHGWAGSEIVIQSVEHPGIYIKIFHVNLNEELELGDEVAAGQQLGLHIGDATWSDIAVHVQTDEGMRLVSYFDILSDERLNDLMARGVTGRSDLIIEAADRDNDPLTCQGDTFTSDGSLPGMFQLQ